MANNLIRPIFPLNFLLLFILLLLELHPAKSTALMEYHEGGVGIVPLRRAKRQDHDPLFGMGPSGGLPTFPPDYDIEDDNKPEKEGSGETVSKFFGEFWHTV